METEEVGSYVKNCLVIRRPGDPEPLPRYPDGTCEVRLDGYVIVPREVWAAVLGKTTWN